MSDTRNAGRPRRGLSRQRVLEAAMRLVDADGLDALSMRRLGRELGVEAMALYRYVADRKAVLDGLVDALIEGVFAGAEETGSRDWIAQLLALAAGIRQVALAHPHAFPLLAAELARSPGPPSVGGPGRLGEVLPLLRDAGGSARDAPSIYRAYVSYLVGHLTVELAERFPARDEAARPELPPASDQEWAELLAGNLRLLLERHAAR